jgi:ATP-dependent Clp protease ATP-binding subunit ClpA
MIAPLAKLIERIAKREYAREAKALERPALRRLSSVSRRLLEEAQSQARTLDDNHVGTEHIVLAIYALGTRAATKALESLGVTRELFAAQLHEEPGSSPSGNIPLTLRSRMIVALAGAEAGWMGSEPVEPEHILLGVIRESQRWEAAGISGPHHLRATAEATGTTLTAIEQKLIHGMGLDRNQAAQ